MAIERWLAPIFPRWAARRLHARMLARHVLAQYDGARNSRRTRNWRAPASGPNEALRPALATLRARARDLARNNPWAQAALDMRVAYEVGHGLVVRSATGDAALDAQVDAVWAAWAASADAAGRLGFEALTALAARTRAESGEALGLLVGLSPAEMRRRGSPVPLALQVVEPDYLDETLNRAAAGGLNAILQGVEVDDRGQPLAYHLRAEHPGETGVAAGATRRVQAANVLHLYRVDRPGQMRGVPDLASVITRLRGLDELEDAALETAKVQACLAAFVTSPAEPSRGPLESPSAAADEAGVKTFSPGMVERLLPGEDVRLSVPGGTGPFEALARHQLHAIAAATGLTYDLLTGDLSQANYSSLRAGRLAFKRRLEQHQWLCLVPRWCEPVWRAVMERAVEVGALPPRAGGYPAEWQTPRFEMVDPQRDTQAMLMQMRAGTMTWGQAVAEMGWDPARQAAEIARWNALHDDLGVVTDADARRTARTGAVHDAAQIAAIEIGATGAATGDA